MSLNNVYEIGLKHALENIRRNGGKVDGDKISLKVQTPLAVKFEKSFDGIYPVAKTPVKWTENKDAINFDFDGTGFALRGDASKWGDESGYVFNTELYVDGKLVDSPKLPVSFTSRRHELCWKYGLPKGKHSVQLKILNPSKDEEIKSTEAIVYTDKLVDGLNANEAAARNYSK